jgi:hypothetical protein
MLRISTTLLENWRLFQDTEWFTEKKLEDAIKDIVKPSPAMQLGRAFHSLIEKPQLNLDGGYERFGFRFDPRVIDGVRELLPPGGVFETKVAKVMGRTEEGDELVLVAKADYVSGLHVCEFKTTDKGFDAEKYEASLQWRAYLSLYEASQVTYIVSRLEEEDGVIYARELSEMSLYRYPDMELDIQEQVRGLVQFLRSRKLDAYLRKEEVRAL